MALDTEDNENTGTKFNFNNGWPSGASLGASYLRTFYILIFCL